MAKKGTHGATVKTKLMCNIYEQVRPLCESDCQAMIVAWQHAERIVLDLTIPTPEDYAAAEAMEPELMQRLRETIAENEQAKAATAQMGEESFANWLRRGIFNSLRLTIPAMDALGLAEAAAITLLTKDGTLKFSEKSDALAEMREQLDETADPRHIEEPKPATTFDPNPGPGSLPIREIPDRSKDVQPDLNAIRDEVLHAKPVDDQITVYVVRGAAEAVTKTLMRI